MIRRPLSSTLFPYTTLFRSVPVVKSVTCASLCSGKDRVQATGTVKLTDRKSTRLNSSHTDISRMPSFFFNDTATTEFYTLSLHDALPICPRREERDLRVPLLRQGPRTGDRHGQAH